jgi:hypothetical protein
MVQVYKKYCCEDGDKNGDGDGDGDNLNFFSGYQQ